MQEQYDEFEALGAEVIAVSVDSAAEASTIVDLLNLEYPVLSDENHEVATAWGTFNILDDGVSAPATYVFNADGTLVAYRIGSGIADRPTAEAVLEVVASH